MVGVDCGAGGMEWRMRMPYAMLGGTWSLGFVCEDMHGGLPSTDPDAGRSCTLTQIGGYSTASCTAAERHELSRSAGYST